MFQVAAFYHFQPITREQARELAASLRAYRHRLRGLILVASEGINATVSGETADVSDLRRAAETFFAAPIDVKESSAAKHPFREFKVRLRKEIVTLGRPDLIPDGSDQSHLSPREWQAALADPDTVVLDARNQYEVEIGKFASAIDMQLSEFREFPKRVRDLNLPKQKKILMYCTGGIRCEKAALEMREQGYENVFQLKGGILEYLKSYPDGHFQGECFVFDYRVAVDSALAPSGQYRFCPHCGQPGKENITCVRCGSAAVVCEKCRKLSQVHQTCSKNCAHHEEIQSGSRKSHAQELRKRRMNTQ